MDKNVIESEFIGGWRKADTHAIVIDGKWHCLIVPHPRETENGFIRPLLFCKKGFGSQGEMEEYIHGMPWRHGDIHAKREE